MEYKEKYPGVARCSSCARFYPVDNSTGATEAYTCRSCFVEAKEEEAAVLIIAALPTLEEPYDWTVQLNPDGSTVLYLVKGTCTMGYSTVKAGGTAHCAVAALNLMLDAGLI